MYSALYAPQFGDVATLPSSGVTVTYKRIPDGDAGAVATVREMAELILDGSTSPIVRRQAVAIAGAVPARDYAGQLSAIRRWLENHVVFLRDPDGTELLHTADLLVSSIVANGVIHVDCDDVAILAGALGKSIGLLARVVTVSFRDPRHAVPRSTPFAHTWTELSSPIDSPRWVDMDTTRSAQSIDPSFIDRSFIVDV